MQMYKVVTSGISTPSKAGIVKLLTADTIKRRDPCFTETSSLQRLQRLKT